jgi:uncharacterized Zn-binding protein involved in type VI secretion
VSQRIVGPFLASLFDAVVTVDPHLHRVATLPEAVPAAQAVVVSGAPLLADWIVQQRPGALLVGPDGESAQWVAQAAARHGLEHAVCTKERHGDRSVTIHLPPVAVQGRAVVLLDDMASTGHTLAQAARLLLQDGAASVDVAVTHALIDAEALAALHAAGVGEFWSTDCVAHPTNAVAMAVALARGVIEFFNQIVQQAQEQELLSGEHFSVDGTLIQAWAGHKSFVRKDRQGDDDTDAGNFKDQKRSNDTHESTTDADARLYRKGKTASELRFMGHTLTDNRHGLVVSAVVTQADGYAEREAAKAMINDARQALPGDEPITITLGADKGYDAKEFIEALQEMNVLPHVAQNKSGRQSAVPEGIADSEGYAISQQKRKLIEQGFGWAKTVGHMRQVLVRGIKKVDQMFVLTMAGYNLTRLRSLGQIRLQGRV